MQVLQAPSSFVAGIGLTFHGAQQSGKPALIEFSVASPRPLVRLGGIGAIDGFGHCAQGLLHMKAVHDLNGAWKQLLSDVPDPGCAVAEHDGAVGLWEAPAEGFPLNA